MRKRSKYRPKCTPGTLPVTIRMAPSVETDMSLVPHQCLDLLRSGQGSETDWHTLASRINWGYVASDRFNESRPDMELALRSLAEVLDRNKRTGKWGLNGDDFRHLARGVLLCDQMQEAMTRREARDDFRTMMQLNKEAMR